MTTGFSNGKFYKNVRTVGEMIAELSLLPPGMTVKHGFKKSADLVVFNISSGRPHLDLDDGGQWDEDIDAEEE